MKMNESILWIVVSNLFLGGLGTAYDQFQTPKGIAIDPRTGTMYISDSVNHRVMAYAVNAINGSLIAGGNGPGTNNTQLNLPEGLCLDLSSNSLLIANYASNNVVRWALGASSWTIVVGDPNGSSGSNSSLLNGPRDVILDSAGNIYVTDSQNHRVQFFRPGTTSGTTIAGVVGVAGTAAHELNQPYSVALDSQLNLYVSDKNNHRVQKFFRY